VSWTADALWLGPAIAERLRSQVSALRAAEVMDDITPELFPPQVPAAAVLLQALRPQGSNPSVPTALVEADWLAVVVVDSRRGNRDAQRAAAGPLISLFVAALHGWQPPSCNRPLAWRVGAPRPYYTKSFSAYPLLFTASFTTRSELGLPALT
jgi:hypothetical protein